MHRALALPAVGVFLTLSAAANAQVATDSTLDGGSREDLPTLQKRLVDESTALTTSDCANACRALASIRRAAEKICALDPDERCAAARAVAQEATRRVRDACPDCALASAPLPAPPREERAMGKGGNHPRPDSEAITPGVTTAQAAPPSESRRGGCAGCTTGATRADGWLTALSIAALAGLLRRRKKNV